MTHTTDPMALLTQELSRRSGDRLGRQALERFEAAGIELFGAGTFTELVRIFHQRAALSEGTERSLDALVALAPDDPDATLVVLVALRPALYRIAHRNQSSNASLEEVLEDVVLFAWESTLEAAEDPPGKRISTIIRSTATKTRTVHRRWGRQQSRVDPLDKGLELIDSSPCFEPWPEEPLLRALDAGVLSPVDVELIRLTRINDVELSEVADRLAVPYDRLQKQRRRAESALKTYLGEGAER
jgi:DNA-directed RNA polymerase specialized sigma24 family protein